MKNIAVSASLLSADFGRIAEALKLCEASGVERIHVDVMDGHFVPNITIGPAVTAAVRKNTRLAVEAHLMIENPWDYIEDFIKAGADVIGLQVECYGVRRPACRAYGQYPKEIDVLDTAAFRRDMARIKAGGREVCAVINPGTPVAVLDSVLSGAGEAPAVGSVLVMSVNPGFSGQKFIPEALDKIRYVRARFPGDIGIDGGINAQTAPQAVAAGANVLITGSYFFSSADPRAAAALIKNR
ncbi:MAG: ribulose-phosphate 3-epimerase [Candidatus Omnitrophica bacterium]|nr:ribulose-phosphate 3-epimerase [Candidatus Omnitrophota bacterium]